VEPSSRDTLLRRIIDEVGDNGLADRSLRDLAAAVGSSHRMLLYHFGSREGLVRSLVESIEQRQRALFADLVAESDSAGDLVRLMWRRVSAPELRRFVRLFFECVAATGGSAMTEPWINSAGPRHRADEAVIRLGVAVTRGLLIDLLDGAPRESADAAIEVFATLLDSLPSATDDRRRGR
jgi:AcrR family transcriptional regulator